MNIDQKHNATTRHASPNEQADSGSKNTTGTEYHSTDRTCHLPNTGYNPFQLPNKPRQSNLRSRVMIRILSSSPKSTRKDTCRKADRLLFAFDDITTMPVHMIGYEELS